MTTRRAAQFHDARNARDHAFAEEVRELLDEITGNHLAIAYSNPEPADRLGENFGIEGHLNLNLVSLQRLGIPPEAGCYLCGTTEFLSDMRRDLASLGISPDAVYQEVFGPVNPTDLRASKAEVKIPHPPTGSQGSGPVVHSQWPCGAVGQPFQEPAGIG